MIRFKPRPAPAAGDEVDVREFLAWSRRREAYKKIQKEARGADLAEFASSVVELTAYAKRTEGVHPNVRDWGEIAMLAGRVERQARKLDAAKKLRAAERRLIADGLADRVEEAS